MDSRTKALKADIAAHGWIVMKIEEDASGPGFAYSIGLYGAFGHPEVIIVGLPTDVAHQLINDLGRAVRDEGRRFAAGAVSDEFLEGYAVTFRAVPEYQYAAYLGHGCRVYEQQPFPVLQMIYPDRDGRWPWQDGVTESFRANQPVLADEPLPDWARDEAI